MKLFVLADEFSGAGPVWMNIFWPHYTAYADSVATVLMNTPYQVASSGRLNFFLQKRREQLEHGPRLCETVRAEKCSGGPNILVVWALNIRDIVRARLLTPVWEEFDHTVLWILDTVNPKHAHSEDLRRFDLIASICGDIGRDFETVTGRPVVYMPPHTDVLANGTTHSYRPIDLLVIGRRDPSIYDPIHLHFNEPGRDCFSVDFQTRTVNFSAPARDECKLLMNAYARAKVAFCFEPSVAHPRFRGYSPMTERWPHAWASGCTVVGKRPRGLGADKQMDWPEATLELPDSPEESIAYLETLLEDHRGLARRRVRNVAEAARRHDTRHRLARLCNELDLPIPEKLVEGLRRLEEMSDNLLQSAA